MSTTVKMILDIKGREVVTVAPDMSLLSIATTLDERKIGAVVVSGADGRIVGIFTERDLVRVIATKGVGALDQPVKTLMTRNVHLCREDQTVDDVMGMMTAGRFRHVPVEAGGRLSGIISIGDAVKARMREVENEAEQMKAYIAG